MQRPAARLLLLVGTALALSKSPVTRGDIGKSGPSFDCAHVTSQVNRMICASPELSALDRQLATDYEATRHQGGIVDKALQSAEARWLREQRNACQTVECLKNAYETRDAAILDLSLQAASPASYDDTRPFAVPSSALAAARHSLGSTCGDAPAQPIPGTTVIMGFRPIVVAGGYVVPLAIEGRGFAFLLSQADPDSAACRVRDVVALPPMAAGNRWLQCHLGDDSHGVAVRSSKGVTLAYWSIQENAQRFRREPIHVIGEHELRCQEPETGE